MAYIATVMLPFPLDYNAVYLTGLEPATPDLEGLCTIHLCYRYINNRYWIWTNGLQIQSLVLYQLS